MPDLQCLAVRNIGSSACGCQLSLIDVVDDDLTAQRCISVYFPGATETRQTRAPLRRLYPSSGYD